MKMTVNTHRPCGLTLIELLVVIAILAALSGAVIGLTDSLDSRSRHQETVERLGEVRSAILGPDIVASNGDLLTGGYLQDIGWLPSSAVDLVHQAPPAVWPRRYSEKWRTWYGWGGPYLTAPPLRAGDTFPTLFDGWGNDLTGWPGGIPWTEARVSGDLAARSLGADGMVGGTDPLDADWPSASQPLIPGSDWVTDVRTWQIRLVNRSSVDFSASPVPVRLKVVVPRWDALGGPEPPLDFWPATDAERDAWEHYGGSSFSLNLPINGEMAVQFGDSNPANPRRVPNGRRMLFLVNNTTGDPVTVNAWSELKLSRRLSPRIEIRLEIRD